MWESAINRSSLNIRLNNISEKERINLSAESWYKNYYQKLNLDDLQRMPEFKAEFNRLKRFITKGSSVLDIGAGRGRLAIPLAKEVRKLTAIEPASVYMNVMKDKAARDGVVNIEFSDDFWADYPLQEKYDLVYSTWSPAVSDPAALLKMTEGSRGYCALELVASPINAWDFSGQIYPMILGEEFRPPGNYLNIVTTLYEQGIYANVDIWRFDKETKYQTIDEAVEIWKTSLGNYTKITEETEEKLKQFYRSRMNPDGSYTFSLKGGASCMIWWKV
ncbi:MAG: bifunctional 3-demethylubiquinone-9 3-methyltransferase/ 2-octaprenyl-6-hydroxy phenol methylase [Methanosaeta sp. PtaU1.Bin112]|nr:MAG: bifunctional 3-demethylubiquinone-9 3-methyltransferase/ 2-octaprenyl-6-hydroxy phenol methylase [Methanosaeta sp. PtaU1.Bin112]